MTVDPRVGFWFSIVMAIVSALGICGTQLTTLFGDVMANKILAGIVVLNVINGAINAILHAIPSKPGSANEFPLGPKSASVILLALVLGAMAFPSDAMAQSPKPRPQVTFPIDPLGLNKPGAQTGDIGYDLLKALDAKLLPDLSYALLLAKATGSNVTAGCYQAWIDMITIQQTAVKDSTGAEIAAPDPHLVTDFERMVELRNALQPDSKFMVACSPVANMVKQDVIKFMGIVISGGAGLATMVPGL